MAKKQDKKDYKKMYEDVLKEKEERVNDLKRLQAEFENFKKRCDKENSDYKKYAIEEFVKNMLPVMDSFELALKNTQNNNDLRKGVKLIYAQMVSMLEKQGVKKIKSIAEKFDPYKHEVLMVENSDKDDVILEEMQSGYIFGERVIRHAKVKIGKVKK